MHNALQVPPRLYDENGKSINKGNIYISETSPPAVSHAYFIQFQEDFSSFLESRSNELFPLGRMVLMFLGRLGPDHVYRGNSFYRELLSQALAIMLSQVSKLICNHVPQIAYINFWIIEDRPLISACQITYTVKSFNVL